MTLAEIYFTFFALPGASAISLTLREAAFEDEASAEEFRKDAPDWTIYTPEKLCQLLPKERP